MKIEELKEILDDVIMNTASCVTRRMNADANANETAYLVDALTRLASIRASMDTHEEPTVTTWEFGTVTMQEYVKKSPTMIQHMIDKSIENHIKASSSLKIQQ